MLVEDVGDAQKNRWDEKWKMIENVNQWIKEKTGQKGVLKENRMLIYAPKYHKKKRLDNHRCIKPINNSITLCMVGSTKEKIKHEQ